MNVSSVATPIATSLPAAACEAVSMISESSGSLQSVVTSGSTPLAVAGTSPQQQAGTRMLPLLYIQGPPAVRVGANGTNSTTVATSTTGSQIMSSSMGPALVPTNTQFLSTLNMGNVTPSTTTNSKTPGQQHFVIQAPRSKQHTFAYLGTIIKPGMGKAGESQQLVLPNSKKLVLANVLTPTPTPPGPTSLLVPMTLPQVSASKSGMINLKIANGQIHTEGKGSVTVLREAKPLISNMGSLPPLQPLPVPKHLTSKPVNSKTNGLLLPDSTTLTPLVESSLPATLVSKKVASVDEQGMLKCTDNNITVQDEKNKKCQDLNRCLQEAVDAIFSPNSPTVHSTEKNPEDEVTLIKLMPTKQEEPKKELPDDDVKIELVKPDNKNSESLDVNSEDFDPMKVLEWKDGIGTLPGSDLKFRMNEFGMMVMVDDEDYEKMLESKHSFETLENLKIEESNDVSEAEADTAIKEEEDDEEENRLDTTQEKVHSITKNPGTSDDIYCCEACGCYGLAAEFVSLRFCSHACVATFANKKAAQSKKERDLLQLRLRRRKKRLIQLLQLQKAQQEHDQKQQQQPQQLQQPSAPSITQSLSSFSEEDNTSNDGIQEASKVRLSWQTGKSGFSWTKYLDHCKARAAPVKLFKDPFPYIKNGFKVGMKMEGIDPEHPSYYCVLTVSDVQGYRIRLHFDGYPENHDFWVNADSMDIFPAGWCEKNSHHLHPPRGYTLSNFNWGTYLKHCRAQAAPRSLFANKTGSSICPNGFRLGMKLEAVDRKNSSLVCVATVAELMDSRILVHFDSWDDIYDYWADPTSPYIHPVGWCEEHGHTLTPPNRPQGFSWEQYMKETKAATAPARAFKQRPPSGFREGMKLECVDPRVPMLIRVATVDDIREHQIHIHFDGWSEEYGFWLDDDSPDIHPMGWCLKTGHPLEPPLTPENLVQNSECPTPGCKGLGHIKGPKYTTHQSVANCPYALENLNKDGFIPDRLFSKAELYECKAEIEVKHQENREKEESPIRDIKPVMKVVELRNPVGRPPKSRRIELEETKPSRSDPDWKLEDDEDDDSTERRRKKRRNLLGERSVSPAAATTPQTPQPSPDLDHLQQELHQSIYQPGYEPRPDSLGPHFWTKHSHYLNTFIMQSKGADASQWSRDEVVKFVTSIPGCENKARVFNEQQIDGEALLMMAQDDLVRVMGLKLGPAIKLYNSIVLLRQRTVSS